MEQRKEIAMPRSDRSQQTLRMVLLGTVYCLAALWGIRVIVPSTVPVIEVIFALTIATVITLLCVADSKVLGKPLIHSVREIMFLTWPLAVPIYVVWSRRFWGLLILSLHVFLLFVTYYLAAVFATVSIRILLSRL
jgi:hypothetical protein